MLQLRPEGACSSSRLLLQLQDSFTLSSRKSLKLGCAVTPLLCTTCVCLCFVQQTNLPCKLGAMQAISLAVT
jgi:hypothetical protein